MHRFTINTTPSAFILNTKIIFIHLNFKKSRFPPSCPPTVSSNPILYSSLSSPSNNWNLMVKERSLNSLWVNSACILTELECWLHSAWNWSSGIYFSLHLLWPSYMTILNDLPLGIGLLSPTITRIPRRLPLRRRTIHTYLLMRALEALRINRHIILTGLLSRPIPISKLKHHLRIPPTTTPPSPTIDHDLRSQQYIRPRTISFYVYTIW